MAGAIRISVLAETRSASRNVKEFAKTTEKSVNRAADALEKGTDRIGKRTSAGFVSSLVGSVGSSLGPAIMPILATVGTAGGVALAAALAASLIVAVPLALGGGVLAAGIFAAARDPAVAAAFAPLKDQASKALSKFAEPFKGPLIRAATTFGEALAKATPFLVQMGQAVAPIIDQLAPALANMAVSALPGILTAVKASVPLFTGLISALPNVGAGLSAVLGGIVALLPYAKAVGQVFLGIGKWIATTLIPPLRSLAGTYLGAVRDGAREVQASFRSSEPQLRTFLTWVTTATQWIAGKLVPVIGPLLVSNIRAAVVAVKLIIGTISAFVNGVRGAINAGNSLVAWFRGLPGVVKGAVSGAGSWLTDAGRKVIDGFIRGIRAGFDRVRSTLGELTGMLPDWKGPAARDSKLLTKNGQLVIGGFLTGLESRYGAVRRSLGGFTGSLSGAATLSGTVAPLAPATGAVSGSSALSVQLVIEKTGDPLMDLFLDALRDRIRVKGGNVQAVLGRG